MRGNHELLGQLKRLFGTSFIGPDELRPFMEKLGEDVELTVPELNYPMEQLEKYASDYILLMGLPRIGQHEMTIRCLREVFGVNPDVSEPCFYNQDWYMHEDFIDRPLEFRWYLIKKDVVESSRAVMPEQLMAQDFLFPTAILCAYTFFVYYFLTGEHLWYHDFVWCSDVDHNGDRIYVGKYHDIDGVNKNGFSIHRHLALRNCYCSVNCI